MDLKVVIAGEEQMPIGGAARAETFRLCDANGGKMDVLFQRYFGLNPDDRYMGSFPYADHETGQPRVAWIVSMSSPFTRDAIVACLRAAIFEAGLTDVVVHKSDDESTAASDDELPANLEIVAMGPSITDTLVGERRIQAALDLLEAWFSRA